MHEPTGALTPHPFIRPLTPETEERIRRNYSLNIDTFIIPSPFARDEDLQKDYDHSFVWEEEGELLGYILVYVNTARTRYHIYKQVTSPFGRGKGIGSAFFARLIGEIPDAAVMYIMIWEKQHDAILFYAGRGFTPEDRIVYRGLTFVYMYARAAEVRNAMRGKQARPTVSEDLGKTRHDARKMLRLLSDMIDRMNAANCNKVIEDVNRETTALINMLNAYRDATEYRHGVDVKTLIIERILPFIDASSVRCEVRLVIRGPVGQAYGHYLDIGRALVNVASNALDAIREANRAGRITIWLSEEEECVLLMFRDNGNGIEPERLLCGSDGLPLFVGRTTKNVVAPGGSAGQGIGTRQIYAAFGAENVLVESRVGRGTTWRIRLPHQPADDNRLLDELEYRRREAIEILGQEAALPGADEVAAFIWRVRRAEVYLWDLILQFSKHNNIREIFRAVLACRADQLAPEALHEELSRYRVEHSVVRAWLMEVLAGLQRADAQIQREAPFAAFGGPLLKSYGQATDRTVIFTMDPRNGHFFATDRKLAEHVDFAVYLQRDREELVRGELSGDVDNTPRPLMLGVWSVRSPADALTKLKLLREAARRLLEFQVKPDKRLSFYQTTYVDSSEDINTYLSTTVGELANSSDDRLSRYLSGTDEELPPFMITD